MDKPDYKKLFLLLSGGAAAVGAVAWKAEEFLLLLCIATLVEAFMEILKGVYEPLHPRAAEITPALACIVGAAICVLAGIDLFAIIGIPLDALVTPTAATIIGSAITGFIVGRGANYVHDLDTALKALRGVMPKP